MSERPTYYEQTVESQGIDPLDRVRVTADDFMDYFFELTEQPEWSRRVLGEASPRSRLEFEDVTISDQRLVHCTYFECDFESTQEEVDEHMDTEHPHFDPERRWHR